MLGFESICKKNNWRTNSEVCRLKVEAAVLQYWTCLWSVLSISFKLPAHLSRYCLLRGENKVGRRCQVSPRLFFHSHRREEEEEESRVAQIRSDLKYHTENTSMNCISINLPFLQISQCSLISVLCVYLELSLSFFYSGKSSSRSLRLHYVD